MMTFYSCGYRNFHKYFSEVFSKKTFTKLPYPLVYSIIEKVAMHARGIPYRY